MSPGMVWFQGHSLVLFGCRIILVLFYVSAWFSDHCCDPLLVCSFIVASLKVLNMFRFLGPHRVINAVA